MWLRKEHRVPSEGLLRRPFPESLQPRAICAVQSVTVRPASFCGIHCEEGAIAPDAERIVIFIKRDICKLIIYRPYDERVQAGTHLDIGMHAMTAVLEPDGMSAVRCGQVAGVQAESKTAVRPRTLALDLDGQEGRVLHIDVQLFGRRHEHMAAIRLAPQYGGKEPHHGCPSYRRSFMIPCPVGRDPHAAIAAMLGMPKLDRRQLLLAEQRRNETGRAHV